MAKRTTPQPGNPAAADELPEQHARVASTAGTSAADVAKLEQQIADLKQQLELSEEKRDEAEKAALAAAEAQGALMQRDMQEIATGKTVKVKRCSGYEVVGHRDDGREIKKPIFKAVELPTYFYKVDIPPVGGDGLKLNGNPLFHGTVYEFDLDTLRTVKEIVYRSWDHDRAIHGSDENFYRQPQQPTLSPRAR